MHIALMAGNRVIAGLSGAVIGVGTILLVQRWPSVVTWGLLAAITYGLVSVGAYSIMLLRYSPSAFLKRFVVIGATGVSIANLTFGWRGGIGLEYRSHYDMTLIAAGIGLSTAVVCWYAINLGWPTMLFGIRYVLYRDASRAVREARAAEYAQRRAYRRNGLMLRVWIAGISFTAALYALVIMAITGS
jgi:hypothetical protein